MAISLAFQGVAANTVGAAASGSMSFTAVPIGAASATRLVVVAVTPRRGSTSAMGIASVTIGGVAATIVVSDHSNVTNNIRTELWAAVVPTGTTATVVVTLNSAGSAGSCGLATWTLLGYLSATPALTNSANGTSGTIALSSNVTAGQAIIAATQIDAASLRTSTWVGVSEDYDTAIDTLQDQSGGSAVASSAASPRTITCAASGAYTDEASVVAIWSPSPFAYPQLERGTRGMLRGMPGRIAA